MNWKTLGAAKARAGLVATGAAAKLRRVLARVAEPAVLFPAIAILMLAGIWATTLYLIEVERRAADHTAVASSDELAATYEAQVLRALREIDLTLKLVKYAYELDGRPAVLQELKGKSLLPPALLFVVGITDSAGRIVASTKPSAAARSADPDYFQLPTRVDDLSIGRPVHGQRAGEGKLHFSRRLVTHDGRFAGVVTIAVDTAFFVSGYEASRLGERGVLGIVGIDGVFLARRTGEDVSAGDTIDYAAMVPAPDQAGREALLSVNAWDGVPRYTSARQLSEFPIAVLVGLSADEQLAAMRKSVHAYLGRAIAGSLVLILIAVVLSRMSRQLATSRLRAVEEQLAHASRIEYLAYHDGLTSLPNRSLFSKQLAQSIHHAQRCEKQLAVMFLDLDRFKQINDTLGHEAGDQLLQQVAERLKACLRDSDTVARLGGDEFVALLPDVADESHVPAVAKKILAAVARPFILLGQEFRVTASIGISTFPRDGRDEQTLTKNADIAMYQAKEEGKNNFRLYSEALNAHTLERLKLESGMRQALERGEFELHYQAKREILSGRITGMEALLRWQHPDLGTVAPMQFIPLAEESGLIVPIGRWVLKTACLQNMAWQAQGLPPLSMAINLTASQFFDEGLVRDLAAILAATGMDACLLELEITESLLMRDVGKSLPILADLKAMGIRIAIDDFGVGYASLATLQRCPLDTIKIDRSFIRDIANVDESNVLTEAIIAMGRALSLTVVAQGVETKAQADFLRLICCDEFQGFFLDLPMPSEQTSTMLSRQRTFAGEEARAAA